MLCSLPPRIDQQTSHVSNSDRACYKTGKLLVENETVQITATFLESQDKSRPGHRELCVTVHFYSQPKPSDRVTSRGRVGPVPAFCLPGELPHCGGVQVGTGRSPVPVTGSPGAGIPAEPPSPASARVPPLSPLSPLCDGRRRPGETKLEPLRSSPAEPWLLPSIWSGCWTPWS